MKLQIENCKLNIANWAAVVGLVFLSWQAGSLHHKAWAQYATGVEQVWEIRDFSGGMVTDFDGADMEKKYGSWCCNFDINRGSLRARQGMELKYNVQAQMDTLLGGYAYTISRPDYSDLKMVSQNGEIFVIHGIIAYEPAHEEHEALRMRPKYTSAGTGIGEGIWADSWSSCFNYTAPPTGRSNYLCSSGGLHDINVYYETLRAAAGAEMWGKYSNLFSYPWWFGYIGRWQWQGHRSLIDGFRLYEASLFPPDTTVLLDGINASPDMLEAVSGAPYLYEQHRNYVGKGRYWFRVAYEYDGYQYSIPAADSAWYIDVTSSGDKLLQVGISIDSNAIRDRVTAVVLFSTDSLGATSTYYAGSAAQYDPLGRPISPGEPGNTVVQINSNFNSGASYFFRKKIVISAADTNDLGWTWKNNLINMTGGQYKNRAFWDTLGATAKYYMRVFLDEDDFNAVMPEMYFYLSNFTNAALAASNENIVLPEHYAIVKDYGMAGDVLIESPYSHIHKRYRNMVIFSLAGQPDNLQINNSIIVGAGGGSYVTAIREWNGRALIWTNDAFEIWEPGAGPNGEPARLEQFKQMGCDAPASIQVTPNGIFWSNADAIYQYSGSGIPQPISTLVKTSFDSLNQVDDTGVAHTDQFTGPWVTSAYLPGAQKYIYILQDSVCGRPDSLRDDSTVTWGIRPAPRITGGYEALVYDIPFQAWSRYHYSQPILQTFSGCDGTVYAVSLGSSPTYANAILTIPGRTDLSPNWMYDCSTLYNSYWASSWTDFGDAVNEKEITGIAIDVAIDGLVGNPWAADTLQLDVYTDGRDDIYDSYKFAATDSLLTAQTVSWRRTLYCAADSQGLTIEDPTYALPVFYRFNLSVGPLVANYAAAVEVYAIRIFYATRNKRQ